ncbi:hypothetical protein GQR58_005584 [Nymphon striatum]|nr:hypothetical protein GQR58_005584 [Nymphon striatum]
MIESESNFSDPEIEKFQNLGIRDRPQGYKNSTVIRPIPSSSITLQFHYLIVPLPEYHNKRYRMLGTPFLVVPFLEYPAFCILHCDILVKPVMMGLPISHVLSGWLSVLFVEPASSLLETIFAIEPIHFCACWLSLRSSDERGFWDDGCDRYYGNNNDDVSFIDFLQRISRSPSSYLNYLKEFQEKDTIDGKDSVSRRTFDLPQVLINAQTEVLPPHSNCKAITNFIRGLLLVFLNYEPIVIGQTFGIINFLTEEVTSMKSYTYTCTKTVLIFRVVEATIQAHRLHGLEARWMQQQKQTCQTYKLFRQSKKEEKCVNARPQSADKCTQHIDLYIDSSRQKMCIVCNDFKNKVQPGSSESKCRYLVKASSF